MNPLAKTLETRNYETPYESGEDWEGEDYGYEDYDGGDSYLESDYDPALGAESSYSVQELRGQIQDLKTEINSNPSLSAQNKKQFLSELNALQSQMTQAQGLQGQRRMELVGSAVAELARIEAAITAAPELEKLEEMIESLTQEVEGKTYPSDQLQLKQDLLKKLGKVKSEIELNPNEENLENAFASLEEIKFEMEEAGQSLQDEAEAKGSALRASIAELPKTIEQSSLNEDKKVELKTRLEELKGLFDRGEMSLEDAAKGVQEIEVALQDEKKREELAKKFTGLSSLVPNDGYGKDRTKDLAAAVSKALNDDNWGAVTSMLQDLWANHAQEADNAIRQLVGTLYYKVADEDETQLKALLGLFPKEVLQDMSRELSNCGEANANDFAETEGRKAQYCNYGTGAETAALLDRVIPNP